MVWHRCHDIKQVEIVTDRPEYCVIGVGSILGMIAVGDGAKSILMEEVKRIGGADNFSIYRPSHIHKGDRWVRNPSKHNLKLEDATIIGVESPLVESVALCVQRHGGRVESANGSELPGVTFHGIPPTYPFTRDTPLAMGRFLTDEDVTNRATVCVLEWDILEELFQNEDPIGQEVQLIRGEGSRERRYRSISERFTVIGILAPKGKTMRQKYNLDDDLYLPVTALQDRFVDSDRIDYFQLGRLVWIRSNKPPIKRKRS